MASAPRFISSEETAYIELLLRDLDANSRKIGLQRLCLLYRQGLTLLNPAPVRVVLTGLLNDESEKVRRWALNALAVLGGARAVDPILRSIGDLRKFPDLLGAAVSALSRLMIPDDFAKALRANDLPLEGSILFAAAQHNQAFMPQLRNARLDIDSAEPIDLRMATILVGLDRAPTRLLSPRHNNATMIGQLNSHDDPMVAQYSVWAIVGNRYLDLRNLKTSLYDIEAQPPNVRGWIYRLIAKNTSAAEKYQDIIQAGSKDSFVNAREGLAEGLRDTSFSGIDEIVVGWYLAEENDTVRQRLLDHMAGKSASYERYEQLVVDAYERAAQRSLARARLEAAARGTELYAKLKSIDLEAEKADLFSGARGRIFTATKEEKKVMLDVASLPAPEHVRVLIVTALPKELAAVLATLSTSKLIGVENDPKTYMIGYFSDPDESSPPRAVIVCQSGMGNDNASTTATDAMRSFPAIEHVIMTGIAGGCPNPDKIDEHIRLGDIVFSNETGILEYDFVKEDSEGRVVRGSPQKPSASILSVAGAIRAREMLGDRPWEAEIANIVSKSPAFARPPEDTDQLHDVDGTVIAHPVGSEREGQPRVHEGAIGTADTLQKNPAIRDQLRDKYRIKAIEMEAGGMQNAAWARGRSVFVVRGICDYCDRYKNDNWQNYAAAAAAAFTKILVLGMPSEWFPNP